MSATPSKGRRTSSAAAQQYYTPNKTQGSAQKRSRKPSLKAVENIQSGTDEDNESVITIVDSIDGEQTAKSATRRSKRISSPTKRFQKYTNELKRKVKKHSPDTTENVIELDEESELEEDDHPSKPKALDINLLQDDCEVAGKNMFGFHTPKKRQGMALAALNTPKTPRTPKTPKSSTKTPDVKRNKEAGTKTPARLRNKVKHQIGKLMEEDSGSDFSAEGSDFEPSEDSEDSSTEDDCKTDATAEDEAEDEPKTPRRGRKPVIVPVLPKTPSAARLRQSARCKKSTDYVPESDGYFQSHSGGKVLTSDHTLDRLKNPRLPADRLFSLLAEMKLDVEHETAINAIMEEYRSYFTKWMYILNEGFNLLLYGLGSKRQLLQCFHREVLAKQTVLVVNGFFPSLTLKDILDSITNEILDAGASSGNPHEAVDMIEEEFALIPDTHLYLIVHNLDGAMLRNARAQAILGRLAKIRNIHLLASVDHINTPLLWDQNKLSNFNFSWWDCTTMLPYTDETAFENSLLVQNSGELALSSMRSVFSSLTTNTKGIYMLIVKYQLKNKGNPNYQGMTFKDLYWSCREAFLVSSDLALRAQLTEFLDHKMIKSRRSVDGSEQLTIPIDSALLQQFLEEQEKK